MLVFAMQFSQTNHSQTLPAPTTEPTPERAMLQAAPGTTEETNAFPQNGTENETPDPKPGKPTGKRDRQTSAPTRSSNADTTHRPRTDAEQELLRKEVIQPHLPVRLPCYDFTPITDPTFDGSFLTVRPPASGVADFRGVTGGVYKARERIHPGVADPGLLATPAS